MLQQRSVRGSTQGHKATGNNSYYCTATATTVLLLLLLCMQHADAQSTCCSCVFELQQTAQRLHNTSWYAGATNAPDALCMLVNPRGFGEGNMPSATGMKAGGLQR